MTQNTRVAWLVRSVAVAFLASSAVFGLSPAAVAGDGTLDIEGSGWGHGVGMSQYGAYGRALDGQTYEQILGAYYSEELGTTIGTIGSGSIPSLDDVMVSVTSDTTEVTITILDGPGTGASTTTLTRIGGAAETIGLVPGNTVTIVDGSPASNGGCTATFTTGAGGSTWPTGPCDFTVDLAAADTLPDNLVALDACRTSDCTFAWGETLHLVDNGSSQRSKPDKTCPGSCPLYPGFDVVVQATLDDYTLGIAEVPFSWGDSVKGKHALYTQAVAARSYAASFTATLDHTARGCFCDLTNSSSDQVYAGWIGKKSKWQSWDAAARHTAGQVVSHPNAPSTIVRAYYASSNGGASERSVDKWGGPNHPFLQSVVDPLSLVSANPKASWTVTKTGNEIATRVWGSSTTLTLVAAEVIDRHVSGSARTVRFAGRQTNGDYVTKDVAASTVASWYSLYSWYFDIDDTRLILRFSDIDDSVHKSDIEFLTSVGAALACDEGPDRFCPNDPMRRVDFAAFMVRALDLPPASKDFFRDDSGLEYEADINALAQAGITKGCNPPTNDRYCPDHTVTRGQAAAFIVRAWNLTNSGDVDSFVDDSDSIFEADIQKLAVAGITKGCNPPTNDRYCPSHLLKRAQMSSFLARALKNLPTP